MKKQHVEMPLTMSVVEAGRHYFGIGKSLSYRAAADGTIPTVRVGRLLRVPVVAMERLLSEAGQKKSAETE